MNNKAIERQIVEKITPLLKPYEFEMSHLDLEKDHTIEFRRKKNGINYIFKIRFLHYERSIAMEADIILSYDEIYRFAKKIIAMKSDDYWVMSSRLGILLNPKNKDGFFNDNKCLQIEVKPTDASIEKATSVLIIKFFKEGVMDFIEKTDDIKKLDHLVNGSVKNGEPLRGLAYFTNRPWQITTGIVLAKLTDNPRYNEILDVYQTFINERLSPTSEQVLDFKAFVEYFKKNGK